MSRQNCVTDQFRDLRDYGVSGGVELIASQPSGNPIMPSTHEGHGVPLNRCDKWSCFPKRRWRLMHGEVKSPRSRLSDAIGVGNKPETIASVRRTNDTRWDAFPLRIIPDRGQRSKNDAQPSIKQLWAVLHDNVSGSKLANDAEIFVPQTASLTVEAKSSSARRKILAGEPATDDIDGNSIGSKSFCGKLADVSVAGDIGPVLGEDAARKVFDFAKGDGFEPACSFKAKAKASYAREKVEDAQLIAHEPTP